MNVKYLRIAALAALLTACGFASAADLADYLSDSTARPRRGASATAKHAEEDTAKHAEEDTADLDLDDLSSGDADDSDLDIPAIPPKMPTLERSSTDRKASPTTKVASRLRADDLPSVAAKSSKLKEPERLPTELPSRAARQSSNGARSSGPAAAHYTPRAAGNGSAVRTTSGTSNYESPYGSPRAPINHSVQVPSRSQRSTHTAWAPQGNYGNLPAGRDMNASMEPTPAQESEPESIEAGTPMPSDDGQMMYGDGMMYGGGYPSGDCATCGPAGCGPVASCAPCYGSWCKGWYAGAELLVLRPRFSADTAYIQRVESQPQSDETLITETVQHQNFDYDAGVRAFIGYRFCDCDGQVQFTYWNYRNNESTLTQPATSDVEYFGQLLINADDPGEQLGIHRSIEFNVYDLDYSRCIPLGDCNSCCPPWSLTYSVGVRIADVQRTNNNELFSNQQTTELDRGFISSQFTGAGPRVGVEGRRFFCGGCGSLFVRTNFSLLLGTLDIDATREIPDFEEEELLIGRYVDSHTRVIPVGEIELGGSYQITHRITLSAGYLLQAWWDLGAFEQIEPAQGLGFSTVPPDTANILGLDGAFLRLEMCF